MAGIANAGVGRTSAPGFWHTFENWLMTALISYGLARSGRYNGEFVSWANHRLFPKG